MAEHEGIHTPYTPHPLLWVLHKDFLMDVDVPGNPGAKRASRMSATYGNMTNPAYPHQTYFHTSESNSPCRTNKAQISFLGKTKPIFSWTCACHIQTFVPHFDYSKPTPYYLGQTTHSLYNLSVTHLKTALHQVELVVNAGEDLCNGCWVRDHAAGTHDLGQISSRNHLGFASLGSNNRIWSVLCVCVLN